MSIERGRLTAKSCLVETELWCQFGLVWYSRHDQLIDGCLMDFLWRRLHFFPENACQDECGLCCETLASVQLVT